MTRGFASPPRDGFALIGKGSPHKQSRPEREAKVEHGICQRKNTEKDRKNPWSAGTIQVITLGIWRILKGARSAVRPGPPACGGRATTSGAPAPGRAGLLHGAFRCLPDGRCPILGVFMASKPGRGAS